MSSEVIGGFVIGVFIASFVWCGVRCYTNCYAELRLTAAREADAKELADLRRLFDEARWKASDYAEQVSRLQVQLAKLTAIDWVEAAAKEIYNRWPEDIECHLVPTRQVVEIITRHRDAVK